MKMRNCQDILCTKRWRLAKCWGSYFFWQEGLWVPQCWQHFRRGNQCGPPRNDWQHLSSLYAYHLAHHSFSLNVFFSWGGHFFMSMEFVGKGSCPLSWCVYQKASNVNLEILTCEWQLEGHLLVIPRTLAHSCLWLLRTPTSTHSTLISTPHFLPPWTCLM